MAQWKNVGLTSCCFLLCGITNLVLAEVREWSDSTGKHKVQAEFDSVEGDIVSLRGANGKLVRVSLDLLSDDDQLFVQGLIQQEEEKSASTAEEKEPKTFSEIEEAASKERLANAVVSLFENFISDPEIPDSERSKARDELKHWKKLAEHEGINYGGQWRTALEVQGMREEASKLVSEAWQLAMIGNDELARQKLLKASRADPEGIQADFTLGLLHALVAHHPPSARKHFAVCVRRLHNIGEHMTGIQRANLVAALNNAAINEVRLKLHGTALKRWREASDIAIASPELIQNLGRFTDLATSGEFLSVSKGMTNSISNLYSDLAARHGTKAYETNTGWLYMPFLPERLPIKKAIEGEDDPDAKPKNDLPITGELVVFATGTGFSIGGDYILTNRHVVEGADGFYIKQNGEQLKNLSGMTYQVSPDWDLALVRVPGLKAQIVAFSHETPKLGSELRVLGYPETQILGETLKVTSGAFSGVASSKENGVAEVLQPGMFLLDATGNPGNSGGPVIDQKGEVLGVLTLTVGLKQYYTAAVPASEAELFIEKYIPKEERSVPVVAPVAMQGDWGDVVENVGKSTFQLLAASRTVQPVWSSRPKSTSPHEERIIPKDWDGLEDRWCMFCNGLGSVECPNRSCKGGVIVGYETVVVPMPGGLNRKKTVPTQDRCSECSGRGHVSCPYCSNGLDPKL